MKPVEGRICQEERGYRGFKRRREFLYGNPRDGNNEDLKRCKRRRVLNENTGVI
jgi:hypothetical protein